MGGWGGGGWTARGPFQYQPFCDSVKTGLSTPDTVSQVLTSGE